MRMSKVIVVTSGKGGVGKTTSTASLGVALAQGGRRVCVVDFDVGLRNLDLVMGALAKEVDRAEQRCLERLAELGAELRRRRGEGMATGLREGGGGQLLGRG